jgi:signal transduction histidine kinase
MAFEFQLNHLILFYFPLTYKRYILETLIKKTTLPFLQGGGEMGELTRNYDWSVTPVGNPGTWPSSLRNTVSMILASKFPMFLWWGEDLIQFYNDAYRPSLGNTGKHPAALGQRGIECWPEIWDIIYPLIHQVKTTGEATWSEDLLVPIYRNGKIEDVYWTFGYSPIRNESDEIEGVLVVCQETTKKVLTAQHLEKSVSNLHNIILHAPVAMCILKGPEFVVDIANERMFEVWGKTAEQVVHKPIFTGLPEAKGQGFDALLENVFTTGQTYTSYAHPMELPRAGQLEKVYLNFVYEPYREDDGSISGIMVVANDVTAQVTARHKIEDIVTERTQQLAEANDALTRMNHELAKSNSNLEEFAYAASHDMKEPIRKIHFFSDRLRSTLYEKLNDVEKHLFDRMEIAAKRMSSLIDDLLSYSQVSLKPQSFEKVDLNKVLAQVIGDFDLEIEQKKANISFGTLPVIDGHYRQLQQVFQNFISNSLKYSQHDMAPVITITTSIKKGSDTGLNLSPDESEKLYNEIILKDNGIGFEKKEAERIFNVFTRLHGNTEYKGTGIGLSIAKKIIENHAGHVVADSEPGQGATFKILLPAV